MCKILETERLIIRKLSQNDFDDLAIMLKDVDDMYAWEHGFSDEEVQEWLNNNIKRYEETGMGYFAAINKETGKLVGQIGLVLSVINLESRVTLGYIMKKEFWNMGYAYEGARALIDFTFNVLGEKKVIADIRPENINSVNLAKKLGMVKVSEFIKVYKGKEMVHDVYEIYM